MVLPDWLFLRFMPKIYRSSWTLSLLTATLTLIHTFVLHREPQALDDVQAHYNLLYKLLHSGFCTVNQLLLSGPICLPRYLYESSVNMPGDSGYKQREFFPGLARPIISFFRTWAAPLLTVFGAPIFELTKITIRLQEAHLQRKMVQNLCQLLKIGLRLEFVALHVFVLNSMLSCSCSAVLGA